MSRKIEKGSVALITGGSSGMGLEFARQLAAAGCDLVLVSNRQDELEVAGESLSREYDVNVMTHFQDLAVEDAADELFAWCNAAGLEIEILVSNAGMFFFDELSMENYGKATSMVTLHMVTPTRLCILFGNRMKQRGHGAIINMSSLAARLPFPGITVYSASKAYLRSFGKSMYHELRPYGVSFTTVCPGAIATPLYGLSENLMKLGMGLGVIKTPRWLVRKAIRAMLHRRALLQPGLIDNMMPGMLDLLPSRVETAIWKKVRK